MYHRWPRSIGSTEICPVQLPGRENRVQEAIPTNYNDLASAIILGLEPFLDRSVALFGHCGSALIAYEVAAQLAATNRPASLLVVSSQVAPQDGPYGRFLHMSDEQLREELATLALRFGSKPNPAMLEMSLQVLRKDLACNRTYSSPPDTDTRCPIVLLRWRDDTDVPPPLMDGWAHRGTTRTHLLDGDHFAFMEAPPVLLRTLLSELTVMVTRPKG